MWRMFRRVLTVIWQRTIRAAIIVLCCVALPAFSADTTLNPTNSPSISIGGVTKSELSQNTNGQGSDFDNSPVIDKKSPIVEQTSNNIPQSDIATPREQQNSNFNEKVSTAEKNAVLGQPAVKINQYLGFDMHPLNSEGDASFLADATKNNDLTELAKTNSSVGELLGRITTFTKNFTSQEAKNIVGYYISTDKNNLFAEANKAKLTVAYHTDSTDFISLATSLLYGDLILKGGNAGDFVTKNFLNSNNMMATLLLSVFDDYGLSSTTISTPDSKKPIAVVALFKTNKENAILISDSKKQLKSQTVLYATGVGGLIDSSLSDSNFDPAIKKAMTDYLNYPNKSSNVTNLINTFLSLHEDDPSYGAGIKKYQQSGTDAKVTQRLVFANQISSLALSENDYYRYVANALILNEIASQALANPNSSSAVALRKYWEQHAHPGNSRSADHEINGENLTETLKSLGAFNPNTSLYQYLLNNDKEMLKKYAPNDSRFYEVKDIGLRAIPASSDDFAFVQLTKPLIENNPSISASIKTALTNYSNGNFSEADAQEVINAYLNNGDSTQDSNSLKLTKDNAAIINKMVAIHAIDPRLIANALLYASLLNTTDATQRDPIFNEFIANDPKKAGLYGEILNGNLGNDLTKISGFSDANKQLNILNNNLNLKKLFDINTLFVATFAKQSSSQVKQTQLLLSSQGTIQSYTKLAKTGYGPAIDSVDNSTYAPAGSILRQAIDRLRSNYSVDNLIAVAQAIDPPLSKDEQRAIALYEFYPSSIYNNQYNHAPSYYLNAAVSASLFKNFDPKADNAALSDFLNSLSPENKKSLVNLFGASKKYDSNSPQAIFLINNHPDIARLYFPNDYRLTDLKPSNAVIYKDDFSFLFNADGSVNTAMINDVSDSLSKKINKSSDLIKQDILNYMAIYNDTDNKITPVEATQRAEVLIADLRGGFTLDAKGSQKFNAALDKQLKQDLSDPKIIAGALFYGYLNKLAAGNSTLQTTMDTFAKNQDYSAYLFNKSLNTIGLINVKIISEITRTQPDLDPKQYIRNSDSGEYLSHYFIATSSDPDLNKVFGNKARYTIVASDDFYPFDFSRLEAHYKFSNSSLPDMLQLTANSNDPLLAELSKKIIATADPDAMRLMLRYLGTKFVITKAEQNALRNRNAKDTVILLKSYLLSYDINQALIDQATKKAAGDADPDASLRTIAKIISTQYNGTEAQKSDMVDTVYYANTHNLMRTGNKPWTFIYTDFQHLYGDYRQKVYENSTQGKIDAALSKIYDALIKPFVKAGMFVGGLVTGESYSQIGGFIGRMVEQFSELGTAKGWKMLGESVLQAALPVVGNILTQVIETGKIDWLEVGINGLQEVINYGLMVVGGPAAAIAYIQMAVGIAENPVYGLATMLTMHTITSAVNNVIGGESEVPVAIDDQAPVKNSVNSTDSVALKPPVEEGRISGQKTSFDSQRNPISTEEIPDQPAEVDSKVDVKKSVKKSTRFADSDEVQTQKVDTINTNEDVTNSAQPKSILKVKDPQLKTTDSLVPLSDDVLPDTLLKKQLDDAAANGKSTEKKLSPKEQARAQSLYDPEVDSKVDGIKRFTIKQANEQPNVFVRGYQSVKDFFSNLFKHNQVQFDESTSVREYRIGDATNDFGAEQFKPLAQEPEGKLFQNKKINTEEALNTKIKELTAQKGSEQFAQNVTSEINDINDSIDNLRQSRTNIVEDTTLNKNITSLENAKKTLIQMLQEQESEIAAKPVIPELQVRYTPEINEAQNALKKLIQQNDTLNSQVTTLRGQADALNTEKYSNAVKSDTKRVAEIDRTLAPIEEKIARLESEQAAIKSQLSDTKVELSNYEKLIKGYDLSPDDIKFMQENSNKRNMFPDATPELLRSKTEDAVVTTKTTAAQDSPLAKELSNAEVKQQIYEDLYNADVDYLERYKQKYANQKANPMTAGELETSESYAETVKKIETRIKEWDVERNKSQQVTESLKTKLKSVTETQLDEARQHLAELQQDQKGRWIKSKKIKQEIVETQQQILDLESIAQQFSKPRLAAQDVHYLAENGQIDWTRTAESSVEVDNLVKQSETIMQGNRAVADAVAELTSTFGLANAEVANLIIKADQVQLKNYLDDLVAKPKNVVEAILANKQYQDALVKNVLKQQPENMTARINEINRSLAEANISEFTQQDFINALNNSIQDSLNNINPKYLETNQNLKQRYDDLNTQKNIIDQMRDKVTNDTTMDPSANRTTSIITEKTSANDPNISSANNADSTEQLLQKKIRETQEKINSSDPAMRTDLNKQLSRYEDALKNYQANNQWRNSLSDFRAEFKNIGEQSGLGVTTKELTPQQMLSDLDNYKNNARDSALRDKAEKMSAFLKEKMQVRGGQQETTAMPASIEMDDFEHVNRQQVERDQWLDTMKSKDDPGFVSGNAEISDSNDLKNYIDKMTLDTVKEKFANLDTAVDQALVSDLISRYKLAHENEIYALATLETSNNPFKLLKERFSNGSAVKLGNELKVYDFLLEQQARLQGSDALARYYEAQIARYDHSPGFWNKLFTDDYRSAQIKAAKYGLAKLRMSAISNIDQNMRNIANLEQSQSVAQVNFDKSTSAMKEQLNTDSKAIKTAELFDAFTKQANDVLTQQNELAEQINRNRAALDQETLLPEAALKDDRASLKNSNDIIKQHQQNLNASVDEIVKTYGDTLTNQTAIKRFIETIQTNFASNPDMITVLLADFMQQKLNAYRKGNIELSELGSMFNDISEAAQPAVLNLVNKQAAEFGWGATKLTFDAKYQDNIITGSNRSEVVRDFNDQFKLAKNNDIRTQALTNKFKQMLTTDAKQTGWDIKNLETLTKNIENNFTGDLRVKQQLLQAISQGLNENTTMSKGAGLLAKESLQESIAASQRKIEEMLKPKVESTPLNRPVNDQKINEPESVLNMQVTELPSAKSGRVLAKNKTDVTLSTVSESQVKVLENRVKIDALASGQELARIRKEIVSNQGDLKSAIRLNQAKLDNLSKAPDSAATNQAKLDLQKAIEHDKLLVDRLDKADDVAVAKIKQEKLSQQSQQSVPASMPAKKAVNKK